MHSLQKGKPASFQGARVVPSDEEKSERSERSVRESVQDKSKSHMDEIIGKKTTRRSKSMVKLKENKPGYVKWVEEKAPWVSKIAESNHFEFLMGIVIVFNCITIGVQVHMCPPKMSPRWNPDSCPQLFLSTTEHLCTTIFVVEFLLRGFAFGFKYHCRNFQAVMDSCLVWVTGVLFGWVLADVLTGSSFRMLTALRAFRLLRLVRVVKNNEMFKDVWKLLKGLSESSSALFATVIIISFVNYLFGILAVTVVGDSDDFGDEHKDVQDYFSGLDKTMFTLLQIITGDSWASAIARPVISTIPSMWLFFVAYLAIGAFVLLNLVTAIIVDNAMSESNKSEQERLIVMENEKEKEFRSLLEVFDSIDTDGSGELDAEEFQGCIENRVDVREKFKLLSFEETEIPTLFSDLDTGDGILSLEEFILGLRSMQGEAKGKDLIRTLRSVERLHKRMDKLEEHLGCNVKSPDGSSKKKKVTPKHQDALRRKDSKTHGELTVQDCDDAVVVTPIGNSEDLQIGSAGHGHVKFTEDVPKLNNINKLNAPSLVKESLACDTDLPDCAGRCVALNELRSRIWQSLETQVSKLNDLVREEIENQVSDITNHTVAICHAELVGLQQRQRQPKPSQGTNSGDAGLHLNDGVEGCTSNPQTDFDAAGAQSSGSSDSTRATCSSSDSTRATGHSATNGPDRPAAGGTLVRQRDSWLGM